MILLIIKIILEDISVLRTHELVDYWGLANLSAAKEDDPEGFLLVPVGVAGGVNPGLMVNSDLHTVGRACLWRLVSVVFPPEGVSPVDDLVVGCQELPGDLHLVDGETVCPAAALLMMINKCQF